MGTSEAPNIKFGAERREQGFPTEAPNNQAWFGQSFITLTLRSELDDFDL